MVHRAEKCAPHRIPVAGIDARIAVGFVGSGMGGASWMGGNCVGVSDRILGVAPRAGLDDGQLGPGRCRSMEETVASPGARCNQFCRMGGRILFRTHPMAGNCLPREEWATLPNGGGEPGERWRRARLEPQYEFWQITLLPLACSNLCAGWTSVPTRISRAFAVRNTETTRFCLRSTTTAMRPCR